MDESKVRWCVKAYQGSRGRYQRVVDDERPTKRVAHGLAQNVMAELQQRHGGRPRLCRMDHTYIVAIG